MIQIQIGLGYTIFHLISVIFIFEMFDSQGYVADRLDKWMVWLFGPEILIITFIKAIGGIK